ncbi:Putative ubiquitin-conjugating enzyme E2 38 [Linum perenne]
MDLDGADSSHKKLKQNEVEDEVGISTKGKSKLYDDDSMGNGNKDASGVLTKSSEPGSDDMNGNNVSSSELPYQDEDLLYDDDDVDMDYADYMSDYGVDDDTNLFEDEYANLQSHFDNVDLPTGVEVSMPWMNEPALNVDDVENPGVEDNSVPVSAMNGESSSSSKVEEGAVENGVVVGKLIDFKQFDMVEDFSDHHYRNGEQAVHPKNWAKRIQEEWKILENNLPDTIFVRVYESRMELLRSVIVGPAGTPYHDGLFVFDCLFPPNYPNSPPNVYYYSGGLRLNPNLYECGKVCLSLLGTWSGDKNEKWIAGKSTMLQVLVSIQALILNAQPFYNEPGYERQTGPEGLTRSRKYSENAFILSLKTMMYTFRRPPKCFEALVKVHFQLRAHDILIACKAYTEGYVVGTVAVKDGVADVSNAEKAGSSEFIATVRKMIDILVNNFSRFGSIDCEKFRTSS